MQASKKGTVKQLVEDSKETMDFIEQEWIKEKTNDKLESYLQKRAKPVPIKASLQGCETKAVTVVVIDNSYIQMFLNWYITANNSGINNILTVALTKEAKYTLSIYGVDAYLADFIGNVTNKESLFKSDEFHRKELSRLLICRKILKLGYAVLLSDVDLVFFQNPYNYFNCPDCDYEMENVMDHLEEKRINPSFGLAYLKPSECTIDILGDLLKKLFRKPQLWKNKPYAKMIEGTVKTVCYGRLLPYEQFTTELVIQKNAKLTGKMQYEGNKYGEKITLPVHKESLVTFHTKVLTFIANKRYLLKEMGLWQLDTENYYSSPHTKYITYYNPLNGDISLEQETFKCALILSYKLNRTLILPKFHCNGKAKQTGCTLLRFQKLHDFDPKYGSLYREHAFLSHPKVPSSILQSQSPLLFVPSPRLPSSKSPDLKAYPNKTFDTVPNVEQLRKWVNLFSEYAVLRFHSMYFSCMTLH